MTELNDAPILDQVREHWQKLLAVVVWKLARRKGVVITLKDFEAFRAESEATGLTLLTWGHRDSVEFRMVTREDAERIAAHDTDTNRGRA